MTISSTTRIAGPFTSGTALPFTFKVFAASDLQVIRLNTTTGVESTLVLNSDYTVTLNGNQNTSPGGTVTVVVAASATSTVTITSNIANLQPTDLTNQGGFYPEVITDSFDRSTIQIQQISDIGDRTLKIPISDGSSLDMQLPTAAQRANAFLAFDANGEPTAVTGGSSGAPATITRQVFSGDGTTAIFTLASDPGALGNSAQVYIGGIYQQRSTYTVGGTTLTFSQAPVAGTDNIEFVNFLTDAIGSTSADLVLYTPTGSGATARTAAQKFAERQSVKDFGAVGNGVADDTTAFNNAWTANNPNPVFVPAGSYAITGTVTGSFVASGNVTIVGGTVNTIATYGTNLSTGGTASIGSNATVGGTLAVTGPVTLTNDLAVNGSDITTTATGTATVFNANATGLDIGGAATSVSLGSTSGTVSVGNLSMNAGYGSIAPAYGCRAWVNFNGTATANASATYSQAGTTTVTVTLNSHGYLAGHEVYVDVTSGTGVDGLYTITAVTQNTFTYTAGTSLTTSGNCSLLRQSIRGSANVHSVTRKSTGQYVVNFSTAMPDANFCVTELCSDEIVTAPTNSHVYGAIVSPTAFKFEVQYHHPQSGVNFTDKSIVGCSIFR
jgi:hypothetical protein